MGDIQQEGGPGTKNADDRISALEQKLEEAIDVIMRRDDSLHAAERRILYLEEILDEKGIPYAERA